MNINESIEILEKHNEWRRGAEIRPTGPKTLGVVIEDVISNFYKTEKRILRKNKIIEKLRSENDPEYINNIHQELWELREIMGNQERIIKELIEGQK